MGHLKEKYFNYCDVIMSAVASQITSLTIVYSVVYPGADQRKHQSSASLAFVRGIHRWPANSPHKGPITRKMFPFDDVIMEVDWLSLKGGHCHLSLLPKRDVKDTHFNTFTRTTWQSTINNLSIVTNLYDEFNIVRGHLCNDIYAHGNEYEYHKKSIMSWNWMYNLYYMDVLEPIRILKSKQQEYIAKWYYNHNTERMKNGCIFYRFYFVWKKSF